MSMLLDAGAEDVATFALDDVESLVVSKRTHGASGVTADRIADLVDAAALGALGPCKFLVLDFAAVGHPSPSPRCDATRRLLDVMAGLIFRAPVLTVAWLRGPVMGTDLELALACGITACEEGATLCFDPDLVDSQRTYSTLARRVGFARAERLMDSAAVVSAERARELMVTQEVVPPSDGHDGIRAFLATRVRRHNAACGIRRAQCMVVDGLQA